MSLIILDRDGVINHDSDDFIKNPAEWEPIDGSLEAIARLNYAGYRVVVITNQSGIARNYYTEADMHTLHEWMLDELAQLSGADTAEAATFQKQRADLIRQLDDEAIMIATYYFVDGMSHDEIARILGVSRRTVGNRVERLRAAARAAAGLS